MERRQLLRNYTVREQGKIGVITGCLRREEKGKVWAPAPSSGWAGGIQRCVAQQMIARGMVGILCVWLSQLGCRVLASATQPKRQRRSGQR
jgi:hypothetical protein